MPNIFYLDYELGNDANNGSSWANAWKTITLGATAARIAPGDIIRIAKSPAPSSIGDATWTNLSKTVTLATAGTAAIDLCETAWTGAGDTTVALTYYTTMAKQGNYCMKLTVDSTPQASILQAFYATGELNLSAYQKISFWIRNSGAIVAGNWIVNLCSDTAGATVVDSFLVPAIPSIGWLPLTLTKEGGGNLGASIKSIAIYSGGTTTGMASKIIYVDNFIACTTNGLNLQSLISKNSNEQGGTEAWYGLQSINGTTLMIDNYNLTDSDEGRGYSTSGTTPETVTTYKRETIKTALVTGAVASQQIMDSGVLGNHIEFQGGYNPVNTEQDGETFFDGLNNAGYGIYLTAISFTTMNYLNFYRYSNGVYNISSSNNNLIINIRVNNNSIGINYYLSHNNTITNLLSANNNYNMGLNYIGSNNNVVTNVIEACNNFFTAGIYVDNDSYGNTFRTLYNVNNNSIVGILVDDFSCNNIFVNVVHADNNSYYAFRFVTSCINNVIRSLSTTGNGSAGVYFQSNCAPNFLINALIAEGTEIDFSPSAGLESRIYSTYHDRDTSKNWIFTDGGTINSEATDRIGGTGIMWKLAVTSVTRNIYYPLKLSIAKIAVVADKLVTVKAYMKKSHATNVGAMLVCPGGQLTGITVADITDIKTDVADTWEELEITFTPSQAGVVEIEAWTYYVAANANVYVEDMTITQAD